jgi:hypothetical protein
MLKVAKDSRSKLPIIADSSKSELVFLSGADLHKAIKRILRQPEARCAVAFWGEGSQGLVTGSGSRIICNLKAGGTNPFALQQVKAEIRQSDQLHAKVYIGQSEAVVASANVSANGLGLEGIEQACWVEAGTQLTKITDISDWFEAQWEQSRKILPEDWAAAKKAWNGRQRNKPTLPTFASFNVTAPILPIVTWVNNVTWENCPDSIEQQLGRYDKTIERQIDGGLEPEHPDDEAIMRDRWVLCWVRGKDGFPRKRSNLWWLRLSNQVVKKAFRYAGERKRRDVVLGEDPMPPVPFDVNEVKFVDALREVLAQDEYKPLREDGYEGAWFKPRAAVMAKLWTDVKAIYDKES